MLRDIEGEARVLDTDLGAALGMARPDKIRSNLIEPNLGVLHEFGAVSAAQTLVRRPQGGNVNVTVYYLNEEQAIYLTTKSGTPTARKVHVEVVKVYAAWRKGQTYERPQAGSVDYPGPLNSPPHEEPSGTPR